MAVPCAKQTALDSPESVEKLSSEVGYRLLYVQSKDLLIAPVVAIKENCQELRHGKLKFSVIVCVLNVVIGEKLVAWRVSG